MNSSAAQTSVAVPPTSTRLWDGTQFSGAWNMLASVYRWARAQTRVLRASRSSRRLSVAETVSLGEKRFVSILRVDGEQFLLGGSPSNMFLLAKLDNSEETRAVDASTFTSFSKVMSGAIADASQSAAPGSVSGRNYE